MIEDLEAVENNIVARLNSELTDVEFVSAGDIEAMKQAIRHNAAGFVIFESEQYDERELDGGQSGKAYWQVLVVYSSMKGQMEGRKGTLGSYAGSKRIADALRNFDPINNTTVGPNFPMSFLERHSYPDSDASKYYMLCRFSHAVDSYM